MLVLVSETQVYMEKPELSPEYGLVQSGLRPGIWNVSSYGAALALGAGTLVIGYHNSSSFSSESTEAMAFGYFSGKICWHPLQSRPLRSMLTNNVVSSTMKAVGNPQLSWDLLRLSITKAARVLHRPGHWELQWDPPLADTVITPFFFVPSHL